MKRFYQILILLLWCGAMGCTMGSNPPAASIPDAISKTRSNKPKAAQPQQLDTAVQLKQARSFFLRLKTAIVKNDQPKLLNMIHFPLQTQLMWMNAEQPIDEKSGWLSKEEFPTYYRKHFFDKEQRRVLSYELGDDIYPINLQNDQASNYYQQFSQGTDPGALLFNYYLQWERPDGNGDHWFGLVAGKIRGEFKLLGYYSKWPVKDEVKD